MKLVFEYLHKDLIHKYKIQVLDLNDKAQIKNPSF